MSLLWYMPTIAPGIQPLGLAHTFLLFGREPRLPVDVEFGLQRGRQKGSPGESNYISQLKKRLQFAYRKAKCIWHRNSSLETGGLYNLKCRGATLSMGDLVLVKQTAWKGRHKIQDRWEDREYQVVDQPSPGIPVYTVKSLSGGQTKVLHAEIFCCPYRVDSGRKVRQWGKESQILRKKRRREL